MSILIKGMEMPTRCYACPCADLEYFDCNLMPGTGIAANGRLPDCPLVELPPHGRLIDADALKEAFSKVWKDNQFYGTITAEVVDNAPTIIEAESEVIHDEIHTETAPADR